MGALTAKENRLRPIPDDFAARAPTMYIDQLRRHYSAGANLVYRWLREAGVKTKPYKQPMPADFHEHARDTIVSLMARYSCSQKLISRFRRELGINLNIDRKPRGPYKVKHRPVRPARFRGHPIPPMPQADASTAGRAADFLKKFFVPVCKSETVGKEKGGYIVGRRGIMTAQEMISLAESKGFDAREWTRMAIPLAEAPRSGNPVHQGEVGA